LTPINKAFSGDSLDVFYEHYRRALRGERGTYFDFPAHEIQRITNSLSGEETAEKAIGVFEAVMGAYQSVKAISPGRKVLDYGCGWGRITCLLPYYFADENIFGVDVNPDLIDSARQTCRA
jgi:2-polyprenyl-3-methyl-5-hydroxy-6-metoxy-1,4-benzoquinol methylase